MRCTRRCGRGRAALVAGAALTLVLEVTALAADAVITVLRGPGPGAAVSGDVELALKATSGSALTGFRMTIRSDDEDIPEPFEERIAHQLNPADDVRELVIEATWKSHLALYNGIYRIDSEATSAAGGEPARLSIQNLKVNNPPQKPKILEAKVVGGELPAVEINWEVNPEPDILSFLVQRKQKTDAQFEQIGQVSCELPEQRVSFRDPDESESGDAPPTGVDLLYRIVAVRRSPGGGSIRSVPSDPVQVKIPSQSPASSSASLPSSPASVTASFSTSGAAEDCGKTPRLVAGKTFFDKTQLPAPKPPSPPAQPSPSAQPSPVTPAASATPTIEIEITPEVTPTPAGESLPDERPASSGIPLFLVGIAVVALAGLGIGIGWARRRRI
jgi:hypothetical protein